VRGTVDLVGSDQASDGRLIYLRTRMDLLRAQLRLRLTARPPYSAVEPLITRVTAHLQRRMLPLWRLSSRHVGTLETVEELRLGLLVGDRVGHAGELGTDRERRRRSRPEVEDEIA